jgi:hypothetical protein
LNLVRELKIQCVFAASVAISQRGNRFSRIVIAVVQKENDLATNFLLEPACARDLGVKKSFWKKTARLLAETDDRRTHAARKMVR